MSYKYYETYRRRDVDENGFLAHNAEIMNAWRDNNQEYMEQLNEWRKNNPIIRFIILVTQATRRDIHVEEEDAEKIILKMLDQCYYCGVKPDVMDDIIDMKTKIDNICGIDRVDSNVGYTN